MDRIVGICASLKWTVVAESMPIEFHDVWQDPRSNVRSEVSYLLTRPLCRSRRLLQQDVRSTSQAGPSFRLLHGVKETFFPDVNVQTIFLTWFSSGVIESFNFGHYLNNMDYAICIEHLPASCRIAFQASKQEFGIQSAIRLREADPNSIINSLGAQGDESCADDYLMIPGGSSDGEYPTKDRHVFLFLYLFWFSTLLFAWLYFASLHIIFRPTDIVVLVFSRPTCSIIRRTRGRFSRSFPRLLGPSCCDFIRSRTCLRPNCASDSASSTIRSLPDVT